MDTLSVIALVSRPLDVYVRKEKTMPRFMRFALVAMILFGLGLSAAPTRTAHAAGGGLPTIWVSDPTSHNLPAAANGAPRLVFSGEGFTVGGKVFLGIYRPGNESGEPEYKFEATAASYTGYARGSFGLDTPLYDCAGDSPVNGVPYVVYAYDWGSDIWSSGINIDACEGMVFDGSQGAGAEVAGQFVGSVSAVADVSTVGNQTVDYGAAATSDPGIWTSTYYKDSSAGNCYYDDEWEEWVCSSGSDGDIPRVRIQGDGFAAFGDISVGVYEPGTDNLLAQYDSAATDGGQIQVDIDLFDCSGQTSGVTRYDVRAYDWTTESFSNKVAVTACTAVL